MNNTFKIFDVSGSSVGEYTVEQALLESERGMQAVHDVVVAYRAALRAGTACTKTRGEVRGGGAKPWRQKGTGRARAGSSRSPVWVGGGVAFGPKPRTYIKKVNKKVRRLALRRAFTDKLEETSVLAVRGLAFPDHKTRNAVSLFKALNVSGKTLLVVKDYEDNILKATANLPDVLLVKATSVNVYQLLDRTHVVFSEDAVGDFLKRLSEEVA